jgi:hypothetical protein
MFLKQLVFLYSEDEAVGFETRPYNRFTDIRRSIYWNFEFVWILIFGIWSLFRRHVDGRRAEHQAVDRDGLEPGFDQ